MLAQKLKTEILPTAFNKDGVKYLGCQLESELVSTNQFGSSTFFITVTVYKNSHEVKIPAVVKFETLNETLRTILCTNIMFYNEVYMYSRVLPYLNKENIVEDTFAGFYHGKYSPSESDNVIILQDLTPLNFRMTECCTYLDFDHLSLALSKLGRFHALSYAAKERSLEEFSMMTSNLKEHFQKEYIMFHRVAKACMLRGVVPLMEKGKHVELLQRFLDRVNNNFLDIFYDLVSSDDPLAVICHGDFCRNNLLFQYTDGKPTDVKFIDIATSRRSSPVIDISLLLFLNSSKDLRDARWDDLLQTYHTSLSSSLPGIGCPSLEKIKEAVSQKAIWGFVHCSFYHIATLYDCHIDNESFSTWCVEDIVKYYLAIGGEQGTRYLCDLVEELVDRQFLTLQHTWMQGSH